MPRKNQQQGPRLFCEWVVGTTIPAALTPKPKKKPRRRDVVKVQVTTDDESEQDTVKITYPRTSRWAEIAREKELKAEASVKKVRFENDGDAAPRKSSMKKKQKKPARVESESESEQETEADSASATDGSSSCNASSNESDGSSSGSSTKSSKAKKGKKKSGTQADGASGASCKCPKCVRRRQRVRKKAQVAAVKSTESSEDSSSASGSEADATMPEAKSKRNKKTNKQKKAESSGSETDVSCHSESSDASSKADKEKDKDNKTKTKKKKSSEKIKKGDTSESENTGTSGSASEYEETAKKAKKKEDKNKKQKQKKGEKEDAADKEEKSKSSKDAKQDKKRHKDKAKYPEAAPLPHIRQPLYVEEPHAHVVITERVIETPEDPQPNAYYDAENNIVRVYCGPVYGSARAGAAGGGLYPKRDPNLRKLPAGVPHPAKNPYLSGFQDGPQRESQPPPQQPPPLPQAEGPAQYGYGFPPAVRYETGPPPGQTSEHDRYRFAGFGDIGAFAAPPASVKDQRTSFKDENASNNVAPEASSKPNPYYTKPKRSAFSSYAAGKPSSPVDKGKKSSRPERNSPTNDAWTGNAGAFASIDANNMVNDWQNSQENRSNGSNGGGNSGSPPGTGWGMPNNDNNNNNDSVPNNNSSWGGNDATNTGSDNWGNPANETNPSGDWPPGPTANNDSSWDNNTPAHGDNGFGDANNQQPAGPAGTDYGGVDNVGPSPHMPGAWRQDAAGGWDDAAGLGLANSTGGQYDTEPGKQVVNQW